MIKFHCKLSVNITDSYVISKNNYDHYRIPRFQFTASIMEKYKNRMSIRNDIPL